MEFHVIDALRTLGHSVSIVSTGDDLTTIIAELRGTEPDLIFNLTESLYGDRLQEANVIALLEMLRIPYTGVGPQGAWLCRDKAISKIVVAQQGVKVPPSAIFRLGDPIARGTLDFPLPAIVKPLMEDGSEGISAKSLVRSAESMARRVEFVHRSLGLDAICEQFIEGRELTIAMTGNERLLLFPIREFRVGRGGKGAPRFQTDRVKWDPAFRKKWNASFVDAELPESTSRGIRSACRKIFRCLLMRDYARIDFMLSGGEIWFLEANPNPNLLGATPRAFTMPWKGLPYVKMIGRIVTAALGRQ